MLLRVHPEPLSLIDLQTSAAEASEPLLHFPGLVTKPWPTQPPSGVRSPGAALCWGPGPVWAPPEKKEPSGCQGRGSQEAVEKPQPINARRPPPPPPGAKQPALRCLEQKSPQSHPGIRPQKHVTRNREGGRKRPAHDIPLELGDTQELGSGVPLLKTTTGRGHETTRPLWVSVRLDPELEAGGAQGQPLVQ